MGFKLKLERLINFVPFIFTRRYRLEKSNEANEDGFGRIRGRRRVAYGQWSARVEKYDIVDYVYYIKRNFI